MAWKYLRTFGIRNTLILTAHVLSARIKTPWARGAKCEYRSITAVAQAYGIHCERVANVNDDSFLAQLRNLDSQLIISVSCPQIFKKPLLALPALGCLNIHGALLPEYRGLLPSFWMMANGDTRAGVTVFLMNEGVDAGESVEVIEFDIDPNESLHDLIRRSKEIHCKAVLSAIEKIESGNYSTTPIDTSQGSYYGWPDADAFRKFRQRGKRLW